MGYFVYILKSKSVDKYYVGSSSNPERRLHFHNTIEKGFTSRYRPWELVYTLEFTTKKEAQAAERKIKAWKSKVRIKKLVSGEIEI
jgi:putative endonuclease